MQTYYDLFQCWIQYHVGIILLLYYNCLIFFLFFFKCIYVDVCLENVNQYYKKKMQRASRTSLHWVFTYAMVVPRVLRQH